MRLFVYLGFMLLLVPQVHADTYSWVDDSGTFNYTEDYSRVPKKYRKKVKRSEDIPQDEQPAVSPDTGAAPSGEAGKTEAPPADVSGEALYGGKSVADWRAEMDKREAELTGIEEHMEQLRKEIRDLSGSDRTQFELLKTEYDDNRATYNEKYQEYTELLETIRKAGLNVKIKK
jgi:hypothetical protein